MEQDGARHTWFYHPDIAPQGEMFAMSPDDATYAQECATLTAEGWVDTPAKFPQIVEDEQPVEVEQPEVEQPEVEQPEVEQPEVEQPEVEQPEVEQPEVEQPEVEQPEVEQPEVEQPVVNKGRGKRSQNN